MGLDGLCATLRLEGVVPVAESRGHLGLCTGRLGERCISSGFGGRLDLKRSMKRLFRLGPRLDGLRFALLCGVFVRRCCLTRELGIVSRTLCRLALGLGLFLLRLCFRDASVGLCRRVQYLLLGRGHRLCGRLSRLRCFGELGFGPLDHGLGRVSLHLGIGKLQRRISLALGQLRLALGDAGSHPVLQERLEVVRKSALLQWATHVEVGGGHLKGVLKKLRHGHATRSQYDAPATNPSDGLVLIAESPPASCVAVGDQEPRLLRHLGSVLCRRKMGDLDVGVGQVGSKPLCDGGVRIDHVDVVVVEVAHYVPLGHRRRPLFLPCGESWLSASSAHGESGAALRSWRRRFLALSVSPFSIAMRA